MLNFDIKSLYLMAKFVKKTNFLNILKILATIICIVLIILGFLFVKSRYIDKPTVINNYYYDQLVCIKKQSLYLSLRGKQRDIEEMKIESIVIAIIRLCMNYVKQSRKFSMAEAKKTTCQDIIKYLCLNIIDISLLLLLIGGLIWVIRHI